MLLLGLHLVIGIFKFIHGTLLPNLGFLRAIESQENCPAPAVPMSPSITNGMLKLAKCLSPNTKLSALFNPHLEIFKCCGKLHVISSNYIYIPKPYIFNGELKFKPIFLDFGPLRTMPKKSRKNKNFQCRQQDSHLKIVQLPASKRKRLSRKCKAVANNDVEQNELSLNCMITTKKKLVEEPAISSASSDELSVLYDLQEEKKNRVYEVITVTSDDEADNESSEKFNDDKKVSPNTEQSDDDIIFLGAVTNNHFKKDVIEEVTNLKKEPLIIPTSHYGLPVDLSSYKFANGAFSSDYMDSVSKPSSMLINKTRPHYDKDIEEIFLSSDSESYDALSNVNLNSFLVHSESSNCDLSGSPFTNEVYKKTQASLKLRVRKTNDMNYRIISDEEDSVPILSTSSSNENTSDSIESSSSVTQFGSGSSIDESESSCDRTSVMKRQGSGDSRSKLKLLRYEEFTEYGNKYRKGEIKEDSNNLIFNLMSYNMLSQHLLENHRELYYSSDDRTLEWEFRWKLLLEEIRDAKPDILCMQEVEERHVENYYNQLLNYGYNYIYMKRTRLQVDGCAIYYNQSKFDLDELSRLEYFNRGINCLDRDNIALVARFKPKISSEDAIVVATTHLLYNPRRHDVRLAQTQLLLAEIEKLAYNDKTNDYYPILLTGDFNDTPNSAVFRLITEGSFRYEGLSHKTLMSTNDYSRMHKVLIPNWKGVTDNCQYVTVLKEREKKCELLAKRENVEHLAVKKPVCDNRDFLVQEKCFSTGRLTHNLKFNSVYKNVKENGHLEASTQHNTWITVDYIFYSLIQNRETRRNEEGNLKLLSRLRLPTEAECRSEIKCLPNRVIGSDHLSLFAKFLLRLKVATEVN